jgi:hypothetical protein
VGWRPSWGCHKPSGFLFYFAQLSRRISDALAEPAKTKHVGYLVWSLGWLSQPTGAAAMQCPSIKTAFEFPLRQMNTSDFHLID